MSDKTKQEAEKIYNIDSIQHFHQNIEKAVVYVNQEQLDSHFLDALPNHDARLNGFITDTGKSRYLLSNYGPHDRLDPPPAAMYILNLYFFTIVVGTDERFLVLERFSIDGTDEWSCPYTLRCLALKTPPYTFGEIRRLFTTELESSSDELIENENILFREMGIAFRQLEKGRDYIEYVKGAKASTCFLVREFYIHNIDVCAIDKVIASERFRYYPLSLFDEHNGMFHGVDDIDSVGTWYGIENIPITPNCYYPIFQTWNQKNVFLGLRVPEHILDTAKERLQSNSISVSKSAFMNNHGLLFMVSIDPALEISWKKAIERTCEKHGYKCYTFYADTVISAIPDGEEELFPQLITFAEDLFQEVSIDNEGVPFLMLISSLVCGFSYDRIDGYSTQRVGFYSSSLERLMATHAALSVRIGEMQKKKKGKQPLDCGIISATDSYEFTERYFYSYRPVSSICCGNGWYATVSYLRKQGKEPAWKKIHKML